MRYDVRNSLSRVIYKHLFIIIMWYEQNEQKRLFCQINSVHTVMGISQHWAAIYAVWKLEIALNYKATLKKTFSLSTISDYSWL